MGLKTLISNLETGMANYPSHNVSVPNSHNAHTPTFNAKSFSVYPPEGRGNNFPLIGPVTWDINDGAANPTFSGAAIDYSTVNVLDGLERGGITVSANRHALDTERIFRFFNTTAGARFVDRQVGLQLMNPQVSAPHQTGLLNSSPANQRTYNYGINTLTQIGLGGMVYGHIKREGTLPTNNRGYVDTDENTYALGNVGSSPIVPRSQLDIVDSNRLAYLYNTQISDTPIEPAPSAFSQTGVGKFISKVGNTISEVLNALGGKGSMLYDYSSGPGSTLGLGRTFIGKYTNTGKVFNYPQHEDAQTTVNQVKNFQESNSKPFTWGGKGVSSFYKREDWYGVGNPGKHWNRNINKQYIQDRRKDGTLNYAVYYAPAVDKVNNFDIFRNYDNSFPHIDGMDDGAKDFIPFYFEAIDTDSPLESNVIYFRAFLDSINDNFKAGHNRINYNGRAEDFYTYKSFTRSLSFSFKIAAQTRHEMMPIYRKLNYLASNTAPEYDRESKRIRTPFMRVTIGDLHSRLPGVLTSVGIKWSKDYPWEIRQDTYDKDAHMLILPHLLDVSVNFQPIHNFTPQKGIDSPFILPDTESSFLDPLQKWLSYGAFRDEWMAKEPGYEKLRLKLGEDINEDIAENSLRGVWAPSPPVDTNRSLDVDLPPTTINTDGLRRELNIATEDPLRRITPRSGDIFAG